MKKKEKINFKDNLRIYFGFLKKYKFRFSLLLFVLLIVQTTYIVDKYLFKVIIDRGTEFTGGSLPRDIFVKILLVVVIVYLVKILIQSIGKWVDQTLLIKLESNIIQDLKRKYFNHLIHLSHSFHTSHKTGSLISRLTRGGRAIEGVTDVIIYNFAPLILQLFIVGGSLLLLSWKPALVVTLTILTFVTYSVVVQKMAKKANIAENKQEDIEKANIADIFTNIDSIKYFGKEKAIKKRYKKLSDKTRFAMLKHWTFFKYLDIGQGLILTIGTFFLIYFPLIDFLDGALTLGSLTFIYTVYGNLIGPLFSFVHGIRHFYRSMADFDALFEYGKIENEIKDDVNAKDLKINKGTVEFKNVTFRYARRKIFSNFSLKINKNERIAFVGHSGSGKSTLVKLLYRLYDVDEGEILIDGKNIKDFKQESLRSGLSIVPQECVLFDDTIYNNIRFSNPKKSKDDVIKAMKFAQLYRVINEFPRKENTIVGERGVKLSGGEKQRVSIARAVLADKKILVLDEATSSLDSQTENDIQRDLKKLMKGRTSMMIAHRLSTIMHADKIVVLEKGRIVQVGKHRQLIKKRGLYRKLWNLQKGGYIK